MQPDWTSRILAERCLADGEFRLAARFWSGGLRLEIGGEKVVGLALADGVPAPGEPERGGQGVITITAAEPVWSKLLSARPPRLFNDLFSVVGYGEAALDADRVLYAQYYGAVMRAIELLRPADTSAAPAPSEARRPGTFDSPVGRYVHVDLEGQDYRLYFEEAGTGIPVLLQHTAGAHGAQWRHLFERREITEHFRLIAYDLPFHGKSLPPVGPKWWAEEYKLRGDFLRSVPVTLARTLGLERPVFMGCSVGGLLALDLALHHPDVFRAVISLEGALKIEGGTLDTLWHPQVTDEYKGRIMDAVMSPTSPEAYRRETSQIYSAAWPPSLFGDSYYYFLDYDLRETAHRIDTARVGVHILSGEYDPSGTAECGEAAHAAIPGSTYARMEGVGHFPMSENPDAFLRYLLPILNAIRQKADALAA
jgi:pimeloyl-ACP methyl ester carboxylesterase